MALLNELKPKFISQAKEKGHAEDKLEILKKYFHDGKLIDEG